MWLLVEENALTMQHFGMLLKASGVFSICAVWSLCLIDGKQKREIK